MTKKPPPVPSESRSQKGPGEPRQRDDSEPERAGGASQVENRDDAGQTGNTKINTTHQGYQQDR